MYLIAAENAINFSVWRFSFSLTFDTTMSNKFKQLLQDAKELPSLSTKYDSPKLQHDLQQLNAETNLITSKVDTSSKDNNALG